jgi:hypothetical protein
MLKSATLVFFNSRAENDGMLKRAGRKFHSASNADSADEFWLAHGANTNACTHKV